MLTIRPDVKRKFLSILNQQGGFIMAGQIKKMLDQIISKRSNGNALVISTTKTKLVLKGLNPDQFTANSEDNADIIKKVREVAAEMGVAL